MLAAGILRADGDFEKGDVTALCTPEEKEIGRGLTNYDASDVKRIAGLRSERFAEVLGHVPYTEVIHRDNLQIF